MVGENVALTLWLHPQKGDEVGTDCFLLPSQARHQVTQALRDSGVLTNLCSGGVRRSAELGEGLSC